VIRRLTPQFSGRAVQRRGRIMKWRARAVARRRVTVRCNCLLAVTCDDANIQGVCACVPQR
jgi:hypothetical protein